MRHYIGVVHKDAESDYGVSFPDFPGAVTAARTQDEAVEMAAEALALHVEGMLAEGEAIPAPSSLDQVRADPDYRDGLPVLVPLKSDALAVRLNVTLPGVSARSRPSSGTRGCELRNLQWLVLTGRPPVFPRYFARVSN